MKCTWTDCAAEATHPQLDKNGGEWAHLCEQHAKELDEAIGSMDLKLMLRAWARAGKNHPRRRHDMKACGFCRR